MDADDLVSQVADRLARIVPTGFRVTVAPDGNLRFSVDDLTVQGGLTGAGTGGSWLRHNFVNCQGSEAERAASAGRQTLDDLQDYVDEISHEPWPGILRPPRANGEVRDGDLRLWYSDGDDVVLELEPVPLRDDAGA